MDENKDKLDYALQCALQATQGSLPKAGSVALAKYEALVGRAPTTEEVHEIRQRVEEVRAAQANQQGIPSIVGSE